MTRQTWVRRSTGAYARVTSRTERLAEGMLERVPGARRGLSELARVEVVNRAMILAAQALLTLVPLLIVLSAYLPHGLAGAIVSRTQEVVGLRGSGTASLRRVLTAPQQQVRSQTGVIGLLIVLASSVSFARALQAMYEKVWEQPRATGLSAQRQCLVWLVGWLAYALLVASTARMLGVGPGWSPLRLVVQSAVGTLLWLWTARMLLLGAVPWSRLWPGALLTGVASAVLSEGSRLVMPRYVAQSVDQYGPMGLVFALASWLIAFATMLVVCAVAGRVLVEDDRARAAAASFGQRVVGRSRRGRGSSRRDEAARERSGEAGGPGTPTPKGVIMAEQVKDTLYVIAAAYDDVDDAVADYEAVKQLYREVKSSNDFDAAVISKHEDGKVEIVKKHEQPTRHGAAVGLGWGLAVGVVATIFPPVGIGLVAAGGAGAAIGGVTGHASGGMSRNDLKELGDTLDAGQAGLIAVYETNLADQVAASIKAANRVISRATDMQADQLAADMKAAEKQATIPQPRSAPADAPAPTAAAGD